MSRLCKYELFSGHFSGSSCSLNSLAIDPHGMHRLDKAQLKFSPIKNQVIKSQGGQKRVTSSLRTAKSSTSDNSEVDFSLTFPSLAPKRLLSIWIMQHKIPESSRDCLSIGCRTTNGSNRLQHLRNYTWIDMQFQLMLTELR